MNAPASSRIKVPPWWVFAAVAVVVVGLVLTGLRLPSGELLADTGRPGMVGLELNLRPTVPAAGEGWWEEMALLDPTPLFLPTPWNSGGAAGLPAAPREVGRAMEDFAPWLAFPARRATVSFEMPVEVPAGPREALAAGRGDRVGRALALRRTDPVARPLEGRPGWLEVADTGSGERRFAGPLHLPPGTAPVGDLWRAVDFLVAVNRYGLVSYPTALNSSGSETVDAKLPGLLARDPRLLAGLAPGRYRITVGP
jgi:hypothetical protein